MRTSDSSGAAATAAGVLMMIGVEGEWLLNPQRDDGTVTNLPLFAVLVSIALTGFVLLLVAVLGLRRTAQRRTRPARTGAAFTIVGAALLAVFAASALASALLSGAPAEPTFLAFLLGMLLLAIGPVTWGMSLRKDRSMAGVWQLLVGSGAAAFAALAIEPDPWHDVSLMVMFIAWSGVGLVAMHRSSRNAAAGPRADGPRHTVRR